MENSTEPPVITGVSGHHAHMAFFSAFSMSPAMASLLVARHPPPVARYRCEPAFPAPNPTGLVSADVVHSSFYRGVIHVGPPQGHHGHLPLAHPDYPATGAVGWPDATEPDTRLPMSRPPSLPRRNYFGSAVAIDIDSAHARERTRAIMA